MPTLSVTMRPQKWEDVIGSAEIVAAIKAQLASPRIPTAWLFHGPPGTGKTTIARILSKAVQGDSFQGEPSVTELNAADLNGVDDMRELAAAHSYKPLVGRFSVVIVDEAQQLTAPAQNVLLKHFEDSQTTVWIVCTTDPTKILKPLRDRCLSFAFEGLAEADTAELVTRALKAESRLAYDLTAHLVNNDITSPRQILMACEKVLAGATVEDAVHFPDAETPEYFEVAKAVTSGNWTKVAELLKPMKAADARGLRATVCAYLKTVLMGSKGSRADTLSECILGIVNHATFEDGLAWSATVASLYRCCKKLSAGG